MKASHVLLLGALFIAIGCSSAPNRQLSVEEKKADAYYSLGTQSLVEKEYTKALANLLEAKKYSPKDSKIRTNLGMAYYFKNQPELAITELKKAIDLDKENTDAVLNLGSIYLNQKQNEEALALFKQVEKNLIFTSQDRNYYNMAMVYLNMGDRKSAVSYLQKSVAENPDYCSSHFKLGMLYKEEYRFEAALKSFKAASMGTCVSQPEPHLEQALVLLSLNRFEEARSKFNEIKEKFASTRYESIAQVQLNKLQQLTKESSLRTNYMNVSEENNSGIASPKF